MSQRYSFEDDSGDVRLSGTLTPSPAAGGTFTGPVVIVTPTASDVGLTIVPPAGAKAAATDLIEVYDDAGANLLFFVDAKGNIYGAGNDTSSNFDYTDGSNGRLQVNSGGVIATAASGHSTKLKGPIDVVEVQNVSGSARLGFFAAPAVAQPSLTSGTATPEQITLALQALGLAGGS